MAFKVEWSEEAVNNLEKLYGYLENKWSYKVIKDFSELLEHKLFLIQTNPSIYKASSRLSGTR